MGYIDCGDGFERVAPFLDCAVIGDDQAYVDVASLTQGLGERACHIAQSSHFYQRFSFGCQEKDLQVRHDWL